MSLKSKKNTMRKKNNLKKTKMKGLHLERMGEEDPIERTKKMRKKAASLDIRSPNGSLSLA